MRKAHAVDVAGGFIQIKTELRAFDQILGLIGKSAYTQFRALQVRQDRYRARELVFDLTYNLVTLGDLVMAAVAHVQAEHIRAGFVQSLDGFIGARSWAQSGHDFHISLTSHTGSLILQRSNVTANYIATRHYAIPI